MRYPLQTAILIFLAVQAIDHPSHRDRAGRLSLVNHLIGFWQARTTLLPALWPFHAT